MKLGSEQRIKAQSEGLMRIRVPESYRSKDIVFVPDELSVKDLYRGIVWASSVCSTNEDNEIFVSVLNTTSEDVVIEPESEIGRVSEADYVEEETSPDLLGSNQEINFEKISISSISIIRI